MSALNRVATESALVETAEDDRVIGIPHVNFRR